MPTSTRAECTVFTVIFGEFAAFQWADVGIGPYSQVGKCSANSPKVFRLSQLPDLSGAPAAVLHCIGDQAHIKNDRALLLHHLRKAGSRLLTFSFSRAKL